MICMITLNATENNQIPLKNKLQVNLILWLLNNLADAIGEWKKKKNLRWNLFKSSLDYHSLNLKSKNTEICFLKIEEFNSCFNCLPLLANNVF